MAPFSLFSTCEFRLYEAASYFKCRDRLRNPGNKLEAAQGNANMADGYIKCPEVAGKTIKDLRLDSQNDEAPEILIAFTDRISFNCCFAVGSRARVSLFRAGIGTPEVLRDYSA